MKLAIGKPGTSVENKTGNWRTEAPVVDWEKCTACGICVRYCPDSIIRIVEVKGKKIAQMNLDYCKGCGICAQECPFKAITMKKEEK